MLCAIHHKALDQGPIVLDESMWLRVSEAVNGSEIIGRRFWDFTGKQIVLPIVKGNYLGEEIVRWHTKGVFRGGEGRTAISDSTI